MGTAELELLKQEPDVKAYIDRCRKRQTKEATAAHIEKGKLRRERAKRAIRHKVIVQMTKGNKSVAGIARKLEVAPHFVKAVVEDKSFDKHLTSYQRGVLANARNILESSLEEAAEKLVDIARNGTPQQKIQLEAIRDILDRCGAKAHEVTEHISRQYTVEETDSMLRTAKEVEDITNRLTHAKSPYLIDKPKATVKDEKAAPASEPTIKAS